MTLLWSFLFKRTIVIHFVFICTTKKLNYQYKKEIKLNHRLLFLFCSTHKIIQGILKIFLSRHCGNLKLNTLKWLFFKGQVSFQTFLIFTTHVFFPLPSLRLESITPIVHLNTMLYSFVFRALCCQSVGHSH